jgi:hypothetical protein
MPTGESLCDRKRLDGTRLETHIVATVQHLPRELACSRVWGERRIDRRYHIGRAEY